jgi:chromosome segregation ATPase
MAKNRIHRIPLDELEEQAHNLTDGEIDYEPQVDDLPPEVSQRVDAPPLGDSVSALSMAIKKLKGQLAQLVGVNEALESELVHARRRAIDLSKERDGLKKTITDMQAESVSMDDLRAEIEQLHRERDTLTDKVQDLGQALATSEQRVKEVGQLLDRFRAERNDASEEAVCLDAQFSRAMMVIEELRGELTAGKRREIDLEEKAHLLEEKLEATASQRDSFRVELVESRNALEEIRKSILAAGQESQLRS